MSRLLTLLLVLAMTLGHGAAAAASLCRHDNAAAHQAARHSADRAEAAEALAEDSAAVSAEREGVSGDGPSAAPGAFILPAGAGASHPARRLAATGPPPAASPLSGRAPRPLLEPPLA